MKIVLCVALALRLAAALTLPEPVVADAAAYDGLARTFAETGGLDGETYRPPGYPVFAGIVYALAGPHPRAVAVVQSLLDVVTTYLLYTWGGLPAAALYAISPAAIFAAGSLLSECLATFLLVAAALASRRQRPVLAGVAAGLATLVRPFFIGFPVVLALVLPKRRWAPLVLAYGAVLSVGLVRNAIITGAPVLSTSGGVTLYTSWVIHPGHVWGNVVDDAFTREAVTHSALEADHLLRDAAIAHVLAEPLAALRLLPTKLFYLFVPVDWDLAGRGRTRVWNPWWPIVAVLALIGLRRITPRDRLTVIAAFAYLTIMCLCFYGAPRFRAPFEALLVIAAAATLKRGKQAS